MNAMSRLTARIDDNVRELVFDALLSTGVAPSRAEVAAQVSLPESQIAGSFERLAEGHVFVLQPQSREILMANPFSARPTPFRVSAGAKAWWGNCIWDALGIIAMTGKDGDLQTSCPDCGEGLTLQVRDGKLLTSETIAHFTVPAAHWWDDIVFT